MIKVGVMGASGYMGGEALRVLLEHPEVELAWATSRDETRIENCHPNLFDSGVELIHPDKAEPCDVVFLALPTEASITAAQRFLNSNGSLRRQFQQAPINVRPENGRILGDLRVPP